ncbi:hypothetical protein TKK_0003207 [Trichogramma kaykai]|uniref:Uncharacterized protein n=1 Tax=Trichogramma kaykai TaxID=54128 RepID=A0ABD2WU50_9HYME
MNKSEPCDCARSKSKSKSTSPWFLLLCNCCCCCCWLWACSSATAEQNDASGSSRLASGVRRHIRSLGFPEGSGMGIFFAVAIPIDVPDKSVSLSFYFEANYPMLPFNATLVDDAASILLQQQEQIGRRKREAIDRRLFYHLLQNKLESYGYNGPACLRRTVCEAATYPFHRNGLLGDLLRIAFRPSTTLKEDLENSDELEAAEHAGDCAPFNAECPISFLDTFSSTM